jgi:hypothetical protein
VVTGHEVLVHTPPITQDTELIILHDEDEALTLGRLVKDKRLLVRARHRVRASPPSHSRIRVGARGVGAAWRPRPHLAGSIGPM